MKKFLLLLFVGFAVFSCKKEDKVEKEIAEIPIDFQIERFDRIFSETTVETLNKTKKEYPFMFAKKYPDSFWIAKIQDTLQQELSKETLKAFPKLDDEKEEIKKLFQHLKYYFKEFRTPRVITVTSSVDYRNKSIVTDSIVLISLDTYLGEGHHFYEGIHKYIRGNFEKEEIVVDMAAAYAETFIFQSERKTLLDEMIFHGKILYFEDKVIPFKSDAEKMGYTQDQIDWAMANEEPIWRYFIERELLFSTDAKLPSRFINPAPFSKFYLEEIDKESPGRIGAYLGWQIVRSYMENNETSFKNMLIMEPEEIFNNAKFKPRK